MGINIRGKQPIRVNTFNLGQNSAAEPGILGNGWASLIENGIITDLGKVEQRLGITAIDNASSTSGSTILGLTRYKVGDTVDNVYRMIGSSLQKMDATYDGWTNIDTGFTSGVACNFVQAKDLLFILNGTDNVHTMNSSESITDEGDTNADPPKGTVGEYMPNNRLFIAGLSADASRDIVYYSDTLAPQTFDRSVNQIPVRQGTAGAITQLKAFRQDELIIYKDDSIFILNTRGASPLTDWELNIVHPDIGCPAGRTVASLGDEHVFLAKEGKSVSVRLLSRTQFDKTRAGVISEPIQDVLETVNLDAVSNSCAFFWDNKYVLAVPVSTNTTPNKVLIWDSIAAKNNGRVNSGWTTVSTDTWNPSVFTQYEFTDRQLTLMFGEAQNLSRVYKAFNGTTDNSTAIELRVDSFEHAIDYVQKAVWGPLFVVADSGDIARLVISASGDGNAFTQIGTMDIDLGVGVDLPVTLPVDFTAGIKKGTKFLQTKRLGRSRTIRLKFLHNTSGSGVTLNEYTIYANVKG